jgi:RNA exonuclease 4
MGGGQGSGPYGNDNNRRRRNAGPNVPSFAGRNNARGNNMGPPIGGTYNPNAGHPAGRGRNVNIRGGRGRNAAPGQMLRNNNNFNQGNLGHIAQNNQIHRDNAPGNKHMPPGHMPPNNQMQHVMNQAVPNQFLMGHMPPMQTHARFISIDVECAATGRGHNDRAPCRIAAVDAHERVLLDVIVHVPNLYNPLFVLTGLSDVQISMGMPLRDALAQLRAYCGPDVVIVGQAVQNDINWLGLVRGQDFRDVVDLAEVFACDLGKRIVKHSLRNTAFGLLGAQMNPEYHNPVEDAVISMRLFNQ